MKFSSIVTIGIIGLSINQIQMLIFVANCVSDENSIYLICIFILHLYSYLTFIYVYFTNTKLEFYFEELATVSINQVAEIERIKQSNNKRHAIRHLLRKMYIQIGV